MDELVIRTVSFILVMALISMASSLLGVRYGPNVMDDHLSLKYARKVRMGKLFNIVSGFFVSILILSTILLFYFILIPQAKLPFPWMV